MPVSRRSGCGRDVQWRTGVRVALLISDDIDSPVTFGFSCRRLSSTLIRELSEPCQKAVLCRNFCMCAAWTGY